VQTVILPSLVQVLANLQQLIDQHTATPMLARTHGQPAIPTTFGKELAVFAERLLPLVQELKAFHLHGKFSGAVGGYQAMQLASPQTDWQELSKELLAEFSLQQVTTATQICPNDDIVALLGIFLRLNGILLDLNQDIWRYISDGWLKQKDKEQFVGSSTMPQKINPIEFENSEGNLVMANALIEGMVRKLPISRLQRDLSESTVLRNLGVVMAHCLLAYQSLGGGLAKLDVDEAVMQQALHANYAILTEAWQTLARLHGDDAAYEKAATAAKNKVLTQVDWQALTSVTDASLAALQPSDYVGLSEQLAQQVSQRLSDFLATIPTTKYS
jgi:adenylosuccinate lyase